MSVGVWNFEIPDFVQPPFALFDQVASCKCLRGSHQGGKPVSSSVFLSNTCVTPDFLPTCSSAMSSNGSAGTMLENST